MLQKTHLLMMIIVALVVYIVTREFTLSQVNELAAWKEYVQVGSAPITPREKKASGEGLDPYEKEQVKNTLTKSAKSFQECYLNYLKEDPKSKSASTKIDWQIQGDGTTKDIGVIFTEVESLSTCLIGKLRDMRFPPPPEGRPFYVAHNFQFKTVDQLEKEKKEREEMEKKFQPLAK